MYIPLSKLQTEIKSVFIKGLVEIQYPYRPDQSLKAVYWLPHPTAAI